jgi:hypothetical protein
MSRHHFETAGSSNSLSFRDPHLVFVTAFEGVNCMKLRKTDLWRIALVCAFFPCGTLFAQTRGLDDQPADATLAQPEIVRDLFLPLESDGPDDAALSRVGTFDAQFTHLLHPEESRKWSSSSSTIGKEESKDQKSGSKMRFRWAPALGESLLYTGIMHTFDLATQPGTRDTLNGHWFQHYRQSVSELRGWSDSDRFMAPYVGHPLEGSIFGFIQRQNDPNYKFVQWGDGREYWISLLRSMAYGAIWHTQWKIGPASEASIGNVMLHASPGFICLVDTPTLGFVVMLAEDVADRYAIMGLENRTTNRAAIILARSFLNPGRTFANIMAFRAPWVRETRMGLFGANYELRKQLVADYQAGLGEKPFEYKKNAWMPPGVEFKRSYPKEADIELTAFPYYESFLGGGSCVGGGGSGAARVNPKWQVLTEVSGCLVMHMPYSNYSADSLFYGGGLRWTPRADKRFSPFAQLLFGGRKVTMEIMDSDLRKKLMDQWDDGRGSLGHYPKRSDYSVETAQNGPSIAVGGGFDVIVARPFAWRVLNMEYTHSWMKDVGPIRPQDGLKISTQAVVRIGTW